MKKISFFLLSTAIFCAFGLSVFAETNLPSAPSSDTGAVQTDSSGLSIPFSQNKFIPDIAFTTDFSAVARNLSDSTMTKLVIPGFKNGANISSAPLAETEQGLNTNQGFNFNYGELVLSSSVDPYFDLLATLSFSAEGVEIEETYFKTCTLPFGIQLRAGKIKSAFGRINEQHEHAWDFADQPRVYNVFFGEEGLSENGMRLSWLVPVPFYLIVGSELLQGANEASFGRKNFTDALDTVSVKGGTVPSLFTAFIKTSFDINRLVILMGISNAYGKTRINQSIETSGTPGSALYASTDIIGTELTVKYLISSYTYISLQAEYLYRYMNGTGYEKDAADATTSYSVKKKQSGFYSQLVFRFSERWRIGGRYEQLVANNTYRSGIKDIVPTNLPKYSAMLDFLPSEFSRIRLQYNYDKTVYISTADGLAKKPNHEVILGCNMSIGSHSAHSF